MRKFSLPFYSLQPSVSILIWRNIFHARVARLYHGICSFGHFLNLFSWVSVWALRHALHLFIFARLSYNESDVYTFARYSQQVYIINIFTDLITWLDTNEIQGNKLINECSRLLFIIIFFNHRTIQYLKTRYKKGPFIITNYALSFGINNSGRIFSLTSCL